MKNRIWNETLSEAKILEMQFGVYRELVSRSANLYLAGEEDCEAQFKNWQKLNEIFLEISALSTEHFIVMNGIPEAELPFVERN